MKTFTTSESIKLAATALDCGMFMPVIVKGLKKQGFNDQKVDMIIRWAQQINKKDKENAS